MYCCFTDHGDDSKHIFEHDAPVEQDGIAAGDESRHVSNSNTRGRT